MSLNWLDRIVPDITNVQDKMSVQEIEDALVSKAAGKLSLQQIPYPCLDSSFEYVTDSDILKPAVVVPYEPPSQPLPESKIQTNREAGRPTPVPNLDDVQPFMSEPDFVEKPMSDIEALLESQHIKNPHPYPGDTALLRSYSSEPAESAESIKLRRQVRHALGNTWKYDPIKCSVKAAFQAARDLAATPNHGLTKEEYTWVTGDKVRKVKKGRDLTSEDIELARRRSEWLRGSDEDEEIFNFCMTILNQELDEFYGSDGTDLRPIHNNSDDEGFHEPNVITNTEVSLPDKSLMEEGVTPGGIFQDSGISMDESYAQFSLAHSLPNTAQTITGTGPSDWPTFNADVVPLQSPKKRGPWLRLIGDQMEREWPGRRQGPYDLHVLRPSVDASKSHGVETMNESEAGKGESQDMARSSNPQSIAREASTSRGIGVPVGRDVNATGAKITAALTTAGDQSADQMVDGPGVDIRHEILLPAVQEEVNGEPSQAPPQLFSQEEPLLLHGNNEIAVPERINHTSVSDKNAEESEASVGAPRLVSEEGFQHFSGRNIPTTTLTTPVTPRIRQIQQVQVDAPETPATVNINFTPEYNSDMDAKDTSNGSLEARLADSPTANTQKGQSALGHYVQETSLHPDLTRQGSSTISLEGSESEEVSLVPTPDRPSQPEGHAGFSKGVKLHQKKSDAAFTLSPSNLIRETPSSSKTAHVPATPANGQDSASFRPTTPFQLGTPTHLDLGSPGTPTPAPKTQKNSVMNVFKSSKLGSRSPERPNPSPEIIAPTTPAAGAHPHHRGSSYGSQGLLFHQSKTNERNTKNVLNSLKLNPKRGSGSGNGPSEPDRQEDSEDELASDTNVKVYKGGKWVQETPPMMGSRTDRGANSEREVAQAVLVPSVRPRTENEGTQIEDTQSGEPQKKKLRRSMRATGGADVPDVGPFFQR